MAWLTQSTENNSLVLVYKNFSVDMFFYSTRQNNFFQVTSFCYETLDSILVCDPYYILLNDRPCIQFRCNIMASRTNDFNPSFVSSMVGFCSSECGEKRVVYINDVIRIIFNHVGRYDLHVSGQYDEVNFGIFQQFHFLLFKFFPVVLIERYHMKRNSEFFANPLQIRMVANDERNIYIHFSRSVSRKYIK